MNNELTKQLFGVRRSILYHEKREQFLSRCHSILIFLMTFSLVGLIVLPDHYRFLALVAAMVSIAVLLFAGNVRKKAELYKELRIRFCQLELYALDKTHIATNSEKEEAVRNQRLVIESFEPPTLRILDMICHNELLISMGYKPDGDDAHYFAKTPKFRAFFAQIF